jgi:hypothetical protein
VVIGVRNGGLLELSNRAWISFLMIKSAQGRWMKERTLVVSMKRIDLF